MHFRDAVAAGSSSTTCAASFRALRSSFREASLGRNMASRDVKLAFKCVVVVAPENIEVG